MSSEYELEVYVLLSSLYFSEITRTRSRLIGTDTLLDADGYTLVART